WQRKQLPSSLFWTALYLGRLLSHQPVFQLELRIPKLHPGVDLPVDLHPHHRESSARSPAAGGRHGQTLTPAATKPLSISFFCHEFHELALIEFKFKARRARIFVEMPVQNDPILQRCRASGAFIGALHSSMSIRGQKKLSASLRLCVNP